MVVSRSIAILIALQGVDLLTDGKGGSAGVDNSESPPGSLDRPEIDDMTVVDLELERLLAAADLQALLESSQDLRLAQCCPPCRMPRC